MPCFNIRTAGSCWTRNYETRLLIPGFVTAIPMI